MCCAVRNLIFIHIYLYCTCAGAFCRYKIDCGKAWEHLGGDLAGQTQVAYSPVLNSKEMIPFNHPIDCHFAEAGW